MKNKRIISLLGFAGLLILAFVAVLVQDMLMEALFTNVGILSATAFAGAPASETIEGTVGTQKPGAETDKPAPQDVNKPSFSKKLCKIFPSKFMLDTITRELPEGSCDSDEYRYPSVVSRGTQATIKTAVTAVTAPEVATIVLDSVHMLSPDGNLLVPNYAATSPDEAAVEVSNGVSSSPLVLHIVKIERETNTIKVFPVNASGVPALPASTKLYRMGTAKDQMAAMSTDPTSMPTFDSNFCQINMCTISEGFFQKLQEKETEWGMADMQEMALYDFRYQNEMNLLFGAKRALLDPISGKYKYMMDGFVRKVGHTITNPNTALNEKFINNAVAEIFDGNNGSEARLMFYGSDFGVKMADGAVFQKQLDAGNTEIKFGITWNVIETNFGKLLCKKHDAFSLCGYGSAAMIIDPANFRKIVQKPLGVFDLDLERSGQQRSQDKRIDESFTLEVTNKETHGLILS